MTPGHCPYRPAASPCKPPSEAVESAMLRLMPGWFTMLDETMDPDGAGPHIDAIRNIAARNPEKALDDIIHAYFRDDWFRYHPDGDEDW